MERIQIERWKSQEYKRRGLRKMKRTEKIVKLGEIFCRWNKHEITGDDAMYEISRIFNHETTKAWRNLPEVKQALLELKKEA